MTTLTKHQRGHYNLMRGHGRAAHDALRRAREIATPCFARSPFQCSPGAFGATPDSAERWCEDVPAYFRVVGYADDASEWIRHRGWYADNDCGLARGTCRGLVLQLPARDRAPRYLAAYAHTDNESAALVDMSTAHDDREDAARAADGLAEHHAEREREYDAAWQAGSRYAQLGDDIREERAALLAALAERRKVAPAGVPNLCRMLRGATRVALDRIQEARETRAKLRGGEHVADWAPGFWVGDAALRDAFNDGAGETVLT